MNCTACGQALTLLFTSYYCANCEKGKTCSKVEYEYFGYMLSDYPLKDMVGKNGFADKTIGVARSWRATYLFKVRSTYPLDFYSDGRGVNLKTVVPEGQKLLPGQVVIVEEVLDWV